MADRISPARGWFLKAESDLSAARRVLDGEGPFDTACFHAQQAAEKLLKGLRAFHDQPFPRTHNLEELARLCCALDPSPDFGRADVTELTPFAVEMRYDFEFWPSRDTGQEALDPAMQVRRAILAAVPREAKP
jgi:HEPN domain-containing protein